MPSVHDLLQDKPLFVINKPPGPTSHQVVDYTKHILGVDKAGHGGTLDPNVTGVLPVATGRYTRITHALLGSTKEYICLAYIHDDISDDELHDVIEEYTGVITQTPPVKSSVKREPRERRIHGMDILDRDGQSVLLRVNCDGGTYIRKLIHDMGESLDTGAHMHELHRTRAGPFHIDQAVNLHELSDYTDFYEDDVSNRLADYALPLTAGVEHLPHVHAYDSCKEPLSHGSYLKIPGVKAVNGEFDEGDMVAVLDESETLILLGEAAATSKTILHEDHGVAVETTQVYLTPERLH